MRKMPGTYVVVGMGWINANLALVAATVWALARHTGWHSELLWAVAALGLWFVYGVAGYRALMALFPIRSGDIAPGSRGDFMFHAVHLPFNFAFFDPLVRSGVLLTPLSRLAYKAFGARIGANSYPGHCTLFDPLFVRIGANVVLGHQASLVPHVMEGDRLAIHPITIEDGATIVVNAVVLAGVHVGQGAVVAAGAVVPKFSRIAPGEIWGGLPARRIGPALVKAREDSPLGASRNKREGELVAAVFGSGVRS